MSDTSAPSASPVSARPRPLSPHLDIYRFSLTMMMSIGHRITGAGLYLGLGLLVWWLVALSVSAQYFACASWALNSVVGQVVLFVFTWALFQHLLGGLRHAVWDAGWGMDHPQREYLAWATLVGGLVLTAGVWVLSFCIRGWPAIH
jgi:succinate dehydrogenase / fumarate reductase cytochrome b subunit